MLKSMGLGSRLPGFKLLPYQCGNLCTFLCLSFPIYKVGVIQYLPDSLIVRMRCDHGYKALPMQGKSLASPPWEAGVLEARCHHTS